MSDLTHNEKAIFLSALEMKSVSQRESYLREACGDDTRMLARIRELLDSHDGTLGPLDAPPPGVGVTLDVPVVIEKPGSLIGPYKLLQVIGEGGMGVVYMAEQTEPVRRRVALKLVRPNLDTNDVVARFDAERQALAMMDHPNVAKVFDAGTSNSGRPYFVMELVKGVPITQYSDEHRLNTQERLELFVYVCRGVQHAHQKGIIHRDLKPSNVLVAEYDHTPVVKIIDFGVAKATNQELTDKTLFTQFGQIVGTLDYMSPEQAKLNQLDIDTRSDIYSLGILLYELLTGSTPIEKGRLRESGLEEILRVIREEDPPRPSTRLSTSDALPALAANRNTDPTKLAGQLREDLDWIAIKAMAKDRADRYQTAEALALDIERHLNCQPIEARRPSLIGRARRFVKRNQFAVVATVLVLAATSSLSTLGIFARHSQVRHAQQQAELDASEAEKKRIEQQSRARTHAQRVVIPKIHDLIEARRPVEAYLLANEVQDVLADDREYMELRQGMTTTVSFHTKPDGTTVSYRDAENPTGPWVVAGQTPLIDVELPHGDPRLRFACEGYTPVETQSTLQNFFVQQLLSVDRAIDGMTWVTGQEPGHWNQLPEAIATFYIDQYEVSNDEYYEFVSTGGYKNPIYWESLEFVRDGDPIPWNEAVQDFVDASGLPGPSTWKDGRPPVGKGQYPVTGISWFEAMAYAQFRNKSLPTVSHWRWAAYSLVPGITTSLCNFSGQGLSARGEFDGIGRFEVYDMAGNAKEWCLNEFGDGRHCLCGGAWNEPDYSSSYVDHDSSWNRKDTYGFRCVAYLSDQAPEKKAREPYSPPPRYQGPERHPLDNLTNWYRYDRNLPLNVKVLQTSSVDPAPDYRYEIVRIDAAYNQERFDLHILLPQQVKNSYETVVYVPGMGSFQRDGQFRLDKNSTGHQYCLKLVDTGRLVCIPVLKAAYERGDGTSVAQRWNTAPLQQRDNMIACCKDVSRTIDYLVTRPDVDAQRIVYFGISYGGCLGPACIVTDSRIDAALLMSAGYWPQEWHDKMPEVDSYQFFPHVKIPVLMINGSMDSIFPVESRQMPMFEDLGSKNKEHFVVAAGHLPRPHKVLETMDKWLRVTFELDPRKMSMCLHLYSHA